MIRRARKTLALMSGVALIAACSDRSVTSPAANPAGIDVAPDLHSTSGADIVVGVGATFQIQSVVAPFVGGVSNVSFRSANNAVATVSATGVVTGTGAGDTQLYETGGAWGHTYSVHVDGSASSTTPPPSAELPTPAPLPPASTGTIAEMPRTYVNTRYVPATGRQIRVPAGGDLQRALDEAQPGDEVLLAQGATYVGNFRLRPKSGFGWITVRPDIGNLPPECTRMTPDLARSLQLPRLAGYNSSPVIEATASAAGWRVMGVEVTTQPPLWVNYTLVAFGVGTSDQNSLDLVPRRLILDRSWVHGSADVDVRRGIALHCAECGVVDSWIEDIMSASDAAAVWGWNGPGPMAIVNNYLEATGENIMFGGADAQIVGLNPSDIEIRRNHIRKDMAWRGGPYLIKTLMEFKSAVRVLVEGNVMENSWVHAQNGFAAVWWATDQSGSAPWSTTCDVTFRYNRVDNVSGGILMAAQGDRMINPAMTRVTIQQNVFTNVGGPSVGANGRLFWLAGPLTNVVIEHNTAFSPVSSVFFDGTTPSVPGLAVHNNILGDGDYNVFSSRGQGIAAIEAFAGTSAAMQGNVFVKPFWVNYGTANYTTETVGNVGFGAWPQDVRLSSGSPYRGKATDGRDPGVDADALARATQGVKQ
jgi:hypothetical protein